MDALLFLLLVVAVVTGYALGHFRRSGHRPITALPHWLPWRLRKTNTEYWVALAQVLNKEPEAEIESFTKNFEVTTETYETHMAVGELLRRRGELEKSTHVYQNILSAQLLDENQRQRAQLALAKDYLAAGILDRAETLFNELLNAGELTVRTEALKALANVFEQEQEWQQAIDALQSITEQTGQPASVRRKNLVAHYYIELAMIQMELGTEAVNVVEALVKKALGVVPGHARARLLLCQLKMHQNDWSAALKTISPLATLREEAVNALPGLKTICEHTHDKDRFQKELEEMFKQHPSAALLVQIAQAEFSLAGAQSAANVLVKLGGQVPNWELEQVIVSEALAAGVNVESMLGTLGASYKPAWECKGCGYVGTQHFWRCPTCKAWR